MHNVIDSVNVVGVFPNCRIPSRLCFSLPLSQAIPVVIYELWAHCLKMPIQLITKRAEEYPCYLCLTDLSRQPRTYKFGNQQRRCINRSRSNYFNQAIHVNLCTALNKLYMAGFELDKFLENNSSLSNALSFFCFLILIYYVFLMFKP